jgi:hypothetical protein
VIQLPTKACWRAEDVSAIISTEALEGHEGIFLATHTPIIGFDVTGSHAGEISEHNEDAVLATLSNSDRRHAFCVIQGEPGSGKSHLIRWLSVNWPKGNDVKLLLQRADGSLEGALRQLRQQLPSEFKELFDRLGRRHRATDKGRANLFLSNLATALDPEHFDPPLEDVNWCRANRPAELVGHANVKREWSGPSRILRLVDGKGSAEDEERNSATASFNLFDILDLARCCVSIRGTGVLPATEKLANRLIADGHVIEEHRAKGWTAEELELEAKSQIPTSIELMSALNRRRNDAIQNLLGISAEGLKNLFRQVRQELAKGRQRLVLLLEDITSWQGIDDSLIDVLVVNADTRGADGDTDMCPLISVVGVTPAYYHDLHGNYRARITHEISLGEAKEGALQDVSTLRSRSARLSFTARYLAAIRAGASSLEAWRERRRMDHVLLPPNRCDDCPVVEGCHHAFGANEGVGLYPFTADALERLFDALNDRDNGLTWKTPRGILQAILSPTLSQANALEDGVFPTPLLESKALPAETRKLSPRLAQSLEAAVPEAEDQVRMARVLAYWGDRERADTSVLPNGDLAFAGVPRGIFESFQLPWIGDERETALVPPPTPPEVTPPEPEPEAPRPELVTAKGPKIKVPKQTEVPDPPSKRRAPTKTELERLRTQLRNWEDTGELEAPAYWNKTLYELVRNVDPRRVGLDPYTFNRLLTPEQVKIEGTAPAQRTYFTVKAEKWVINGLEAYIAFRLDKDKTSQDVEFHRHSLVVMMRRLEQLVSDYADLRLSKLSDGIRWSPTPAITQILLARAWFRGVTLPNAPLQSQLRVILSDEVEAESDPTARCVPWQEFLNKTKPRHDDFRSALRQMLGTPQGESRGFGLADVSLAAGAIRRFCNTLKFDALPTDQTETGVTEFDKARELINGVESSLVRIVRIERDQIWQRADLLQKTLRQRSISDHFARVDQAIVSVANDLPSAAPDQVRNWKSAYAKIQPRLDATVAADKAVEEVLFSISEDSETIPTQNEALLGWLLRVPARDLEDFRGLCQLGELVVKTLLGHVEGCVRDGKGVVSLEDIHKVGRELVRATSGTENGTVAEVA